MARGADSQSGHLGLPFGVGRHLDPIVVQAGDQAHDRVADPQGPGGLVPGRRLWVYEGRTPAAQGQPALPP